jgi:SAM-dependent methyltransferase
MIMNRPAVRITELTADAPAVVWEETPCPLCGRAAGTPVLEASDPLPPHDTGLVFAIVRCAHCELLYTNPRPDPESVAQFYPSDYQPYRRPRKLQQARPARPFWARLFGRPCAERRGALPWPRPGRLLDFGCGAGSFLKTMADQGWQVTGLDAAVGAVNQVRDLHGLTALAGTLPHPDLRPGSFDVVTMWHSLEHVHHPLAILRAAHDLLIPGGKLVVATPNIDGLPFHLFGRSWFGLDLPRHLTHFTPRTLTLLLQTAGFRTEPVRFLRHNDWLRSSARLARKTSGGGVLARALAWKPAAKMASWLCYALGVSDCMMCVAERPT